MFKSKPDYEQAQKRIDAFWNHEETDRPMVLMNYPKQTAKPFKNKQHASSKDYWLDIEYRAEEALHYAENTVYCAESMPVYYPNLGPEILSVWAGCEIVFEKTTVWTEPCISDWTTENAVISMDHPMFKTLEKFTRILLEKAKGNFIVGLTDFHPGGDHLSALRDAEKLLVDMLEVPDIIKAKLVSSYKEYFEVYDYFVKILKEANMPIATWLQITSQTTMYVPSNDFSCMISSEMFNEFFLEGIRDECRHYKKSIYHLDGPGALQHLDSLLEIPELNALQWVPGAGNEWVMPWLDVFKKALKAEKSIIVYPQNIEDLHFLKEHLPSKGLCIQMWNVGNQENADDLMKIIKRWG